MKILVLKNKSLLSEDNNIQQILDFLNYKKIEYLIKNIEDIKKFDFDIIYDFVLAIGGDGTIIKSSKVAYYMKVPVFGINAGHLGFLSGMDLNNDIKFNIEKLYKKKYSINKRYLLDVCVYRNDKLVFQDVAINDTHCLSSNISDISSFDINIKNVNDKEFFNITDDLRSCGIIVSSPTGATGFTFSLDGPIIAPSVKCFIITPIYPHTFNQRPIIIDDKKVIKIEISKNNQYLFIDGYRVLKLKSNDKIIIKKSQNFVRFIELSKNIFFKNLKNKIKNF